MLEQRKELQSMPGGGTVRSHQRFVDAVVVNVQCDNLPAPLTSSRGQML